MATLNPERDTIATAELTPAAILDTSIGRLHVLATVIMTVHLQPPMEFADPRPMPLSGSPDWPRRLACRVAASPPNVREHWDRWLRARELIV